MKKLVSKLSLLAILFSSLYSGVPAQAAGVVVTLSPTSSSSFGSPGISETVSWTRSGTASYATGTTVTVTITPAITSVSSTASFALDQGGSNNASFTSSSTDGFSTYLTFTVSAATAASTTFAIPLTNFTFPSTAQNYSVSIFASNPTDFGSALFYANGGNLVNVTASVPATLAFSIRNSADSANTNSCALGTLTTASTSTCSYRLRVQTNAASGFSTTIQADHDLASGSATMTAVTNDVVGTAGTEAYGIQTLTGATDGGRNVSTGLFDQPVVESNIAGTTFNVDPSPVPTTTAVTIISYPASFSIATNPSLTGTSLVTHFANISGGTPAGNYTQTVTYLVTATY